MLTLCAAAVLAGMRSFTAIAGWVADVPAEVQAARALVNAVTDTLKRSLEPVHVTVELGIIY